MNLLGLLADVPPWRGDAVGLALGSAVYEYEVVDSCIL